MAKVAVITGSNRLIGNLPSPRAFRASCRRHQRGPEGAGNWPHYRCDLTDLVRMSATLAAIEPDH